MAGGFLEGKEMSVRASKSEEILDQTTAITDDDLNTSYILSPGVNAYTSKSILFYNFLEPVDIDGYQLKTSVVSHIIFVLRKKDGTVFNLSPETGLIMDGTKINFPTVNDVVGIEIRNTHFVSGNNITIYELDIFGIINKYLFQEGEEIKKYENDWQTIGTAPATKEMFDTHGMTDLSILDNEAIQGLESDEVELLCWTDEEGQPAQSKVDHSVKVNLTNGVEFITPISFLDFNSKIISIN